MPANKRPKLTFYDSSSGVEWTLKVESETKLKAIRAFLNELLGIGEVNGMIPSRPDYYVVTAEQYQKVRRFVTGVSADQR